MSDLKRSCPSCQAHTSDVGTDFLNGDPCRYCGLPALAAFEFDAARKRGAEQGVVEMAAKAEARAATAEREVERLSGLLQEIGSTVERAREGA